MVNKDDQQEQTTGDQALARLDQALSAALFRHDCPDSMQIGRYQLGLLGRQEAQATQRHLQRCSYCRAEIIDFEGFLRTEEWQRASGIEWRWNELGTLLLQLLAPPSSPAPAYRSSQDTTNTEIIRHARLGMEHVDNLEVQVLVYKAQEQVDHTRQDERKQDEIIVGYTVEIEIVRPNSIFDAELAGIAIQAQAGEWQSAAVTDSDGQVRFSRLPPEKLDELRIEVNLTP